MNTQRFTTRVSANLLLEKNGKILLYLRNKTGYEDGNYAFVGGHLDGAETVKLAMIREAKEEIGIIIKPKDLHVVHVMHHNSNHEFVHFFLNCIKWTGIITNMEPEKCAELVFCDKNKLPKNMVPYVKHALENILQRKWYSEFAWEAPSKIKKDYAEAINS